MSNSVSYNYSPGDNVYCINTLGPNAQYPYWGYPYVTGWPYNGPIGYSTNYPNGFTSTTPAIQSGVILQTRILFTNTTVGPTIMYDVRLVGEYGTTTFPESNVYPGNVATAGTQEVDYNGTLIQTTAIVATGVHTTTIVVDGQPHVVTVDLSTTPTLANVLTSVNAQISGEALVVLTGGNLVVKSNSVGSASTIYIVPGAPDIFADIPGYVSVLPPVVGEPSGLDQATAAYELLVK